MKTITNTIKIYLKNSNEKIKKTIQSNIDTNIFLLFQKNPFSKLDLNNESDEESNYSSDEDIQIIKNTIEYYENEQKIKRARGENLSPNYLNHSSSSISYQYDISELVNAIKHF